MLKLSKTWVLSLSGLLMLASGSLLLRKGMIYLSQTVQALRSSDAASFSAPLVKWLMNHVTAPFGWAYNLQEALITVLVLAIVIGSVKAHFVMKKVVKRSVAHIESYGGSVPFYAIFPTRSLFIIALMMMIGMSFNKLGLPYDVRGLIDATIGFALIRCGSFYFREIWVPKLTAQKK